MEHLPLLPFEHEDRREGEQHDEQREEDGPPHLLGRDEHRLEVVGLLAPLALLGQVAVRVLDHDDGGIHQDAHGDRHPAQAHDVAGDAELAHQDEAHQHRDGHREDDDESRADVEEEEQHHQADDDRLLDQRLFEGIDGALDEVRAVIGRMDAHARGQALLQLDQLRLDPVDDRLGVLAVAHHDDAADDLALAVLVEDPAPRLGAQLDAPHVRDRHGDAAGGGLDDDLLKIGSALDVAPAPYRVLGRVLLDQAAAHLVVAHPDGIRHFLQVDAVGEELGGIDLDLVLADEAPDGGHLGDPRHALELEAQVPVLDGAQAPEIMALALDGVPVDVAHPGPVGTEHRGHPGRQGARHRGQALQDPRPGEVEVRLVVEDHVDHREAEGRAAPDRLDVGQALEARRERVGDLVLDDLRATARPLGEDDDLVLGEVRDRIQRGPGDGEGAPADQADQRDEDDEAVANRPFDDALDHQ
ncbi:hypothetical protein D3C86_1133070 [compost metagenome]